MPANLRPTIGAQTRTITMKARLVMITSLSQLVYVPKTTLRK